ncbi:MAG: CHAT domain-containing protein [Chloroflexi bacterium]|nr:CHAT domain-containing protein [Chloroflexota bacterium]
MEYLDFELEIGLGQGRDYPLQVVHSPAGERRATMRFPFDELELENHLLRVQNALLQGGSTRRRIASLSTQAVEDFGTALYESLLSGDVRTAFELSRHEAARHDKGLRIKLRIQDPALAALPWEFLYDRSMGEFVALSTHTPIVRYLDLPRAIQPLPVSPPLRILGMIASPDDLPPLNVERERLRVERALADIQGKGLVELTWLDGASWRDLQRAMRRGPWHILHFVGHGRFDVNLDEGCLAFVGEQGETDELTASQIGRLLADHRSLRLVMLNACEGAKGGKGDIFSGTAATLVRRGIPAVVAMQYEITDRAAIEFARTFYDAIAEEMPLDAAVAEARKTVSVEITNTVEWGTPVLFMRSPDGVLFTVQDRDKARPTATATLPAVAPVAPAASEAEPAQVTPAPPFDRDAFEAELRERWAAEERIRDAAEAAERAAEAGRTAAEAAERAATAERATSAKQSAKASPVPTQVSRSTTPPVTPTPPSEPTVPAGRPTTIEPASPTVGPLPVGSAAPAPAPASPSQASDRLRFTVMGMDGELLVSSDWVGIRRRPPQPKRPDRLEPTARLVAVHLVESGPAGRGFIQICFEGEDPTQLMFWTVGSSRSTVQFTPAQQPQFISAKQWLDYYVALRRN